MTASKFILPEGFDSPCADISYQWISERNGRLVVLMHFSRVIENRDYDLELIFEHPIALQWEDESYGLIGLPQNRPTSGGWTYPSLTINNSEWADRYAASVCTEEEFEKHGIVHYAFISMNDLLHVLSGKPPVVKVIQAGKA